MGRNPWESPFRTECPGVVELRPPGEETGKLGSEEAESRGLVLGSRFWVLGAIPPNPFSRRAAEAQRIHLTRNT
jgi:hypothetical protein